MLQTATPNAASLIAKAPSTGVSQSSILATKEKESDPFKPPKEKGRRAIFCDPITLPSPTSPNNPPIIHQPHLPTQDANVGKMITPTWSVQPSAADQVQFCTIPGKSGTDQTDKSSVNPPEKSSFSRLISNVKRTPSLSAADKNTNKEKDNKNKSSTLPRKPKAGKLDRNSLRNLEISSPILQSEVDPSVNLVPVCKSQDDETDSVSRLSPVPEPVIKSSPSSKRPAPRPPAKPERVNPSSPVKAAAQPQNDDIKVKEKVRARYNPPWRSKQSNKSTENPETDPAPKISSSDDSLESKTMPSSTQGGRNRRPASIATSKPIRPTGPPPKPPPSQDVSPMTSAIQSRAAPLANIRETVSPSLNEPIYDTITESTKCASVLSPEEFETPCGSPTTFKKSLDTLSTGSSAEEDLMKEILKEVHVKSEGDSIYSSLMRKDKHKRRRQPRDATSES